ncbi:hypothetical protein [Haliangium sp.]|uniref:hypothetical protein n=1 Tax=Haliangium sp. TaxID=2663208 RepID=UPI003D0BA62A
MDHEAPTIDSDNPFDLVAYLLFSIRHSFENEPSDRPPRWIRIARVNDAQGGIDGIGQGVKAVMDGFVSALSWMSDIILDIEALLIQTDAAKALAEVTLDFLKAATSEEFTNGVKSLLSTDVDFSAVEKVNGVLDDIKGVLEYIPEPDDLVGVGHELYRMLAIVQRPLPPRVDGLPGVGDDIVASPDVHVEYSPRGGTGKLRFLQWAFGLDYRVRGLRADKDADASTEVVVSRLGARRLPLTGVFPNVSELSWSRDELTVEVFRFTWDASDKNDLIAANTILDALGYRYYPQGGGEPKAPGQATAADRANEAILPARLERFQMVNDLPLTGQLDNDTLNRLFGFDHQRQNLARPKPFDPDAVVIPSLTLAQRAGYFPLANHDAESPNSAITTHTRPDPNEAEYNRYRYYLAATEVPLLSPGSVEPDSGWLCDARPTRLIPGRDNESSEWISVAHELGFVGLASRVLTPPLVERGNRQVYDFANGQAWWLSEGEGASGRFFFCARAVQPWVPGRFASPPPNSPDSLFGPHDNDPPAGAVSQMYQWVDLTPLHTLRAGIGITDTTDLLLTASVLQRSLFRQYSADQGRVRCELYTDQDYDGVMRPNIDQASVPPYQQSAWYPNSEAVDASLHLSNKARKRNWVYRKSPEMVVTPDKTKALVILEGKLNSGWDIDAYFDDVRLRWEIRPKETLGA